MKRYLTGLAFFLSCFQLLAQNQIVEPWKTWADMHEYCHSNGTEYTTDFIRFEGDTIVENMTYKKVLLSEDENQENWTFAGYFIREENQKVYLRRPFEEEGLCYDFSLEQIGDTVTIYNPLTTSSLLLTLAEIDSVATSDGWRERWKLTAEGYQTPEYWFKGIGSLSGILYSGTGVFGGLCGSSTLLCEHEHDTLIYQNPDYGSCYIVTTGIYQSDAPPLIQSFIWNNGTLRLTFNEGGEYQIKITTLPGTTIYNKHINGTRWSYTVRNTPHGLAFVTVTRQNRRATRKIILP